MSQDEFLRWEAYDRETPIDLESVHHLPIGYFGAQYFGSKVEKGKAPTPRECMPLLALGNFTADEPSSSAMIDTMNAIAAAQNESIK